MIFLLLLLTSCAAEPESDPCVALQDALAACDHYGPADTYECEPRGSDEFADLYRCMADYIEASGCGGSGAGYETLTGPAYEACAE